jgi:nucleoid-associated protein YgaU
MVLFAFGVVVGLSFLIAAPTLPNERERTSAAPQPTRPVRAPAALGGPAPAGVSPTEPAAAPPMSTPTAEAVRRYTIQPGDTLLRIAERYDTTVDAIRAANPGLSETALQVGAEIVIPPSR